VSAVKYWTDGRGNSAQFVDYKGNISLKNTTGDSIAYLALRDLTIQEKEACTLFFRMIPGPDTASGSTNLVGLTDKVQRSYGDAFFNIGPVVYASALTNEAYAIDTNAWYLGAINNFFGGNSSPPVDFPPEPLLSDTVYNVWINITNAPMVERANDIFSVYIQKEGASTRTLLFQDYLSDRDFDYVEPVLGGMFPNLDKLVVLGNNATLSATFDDFYLSKGGYNATVPKAYGFTGPVGPLPPLQISVVGGEVEIRWTTGTLQESSSLTGGWTDVVGAAPPSYKASPAAGPKFYRARQ
jgi:hypothetical protein